MGTEYNPRITSSGDSRESQFSQILVYNRALSAQEVLQNYNATKRRYGL